MPVLYRIDPSLKLIYSAAFGICTGVDFFQAERRAFQHELSRAEMQVIIDVSTAKEVDFGLQDISQAIALMKERKLQNHKFEKTAVISLGSFAEMFVKAYGLLSEAAVEIVVFRSMEEAVKCLGLSESIAQVLQIKNSLADEFQKQPSGRADIGG